MRVVAGYSFFAGNIGLGWFCLTSGFGMLIAVVQLTFMMKHRTRLEPAGSDRIRRG
jgi:hypothetical protein